MTLQLKNITSQLRVNFLTDAGGKTECRYFESYGNLGVGAKTFDLVLTGTVNSQYTTLCAHATICSPARTVILKYFIWSVYTGALMQLGYVRPAIIKMFLYVYNIITRRIGLYTLGIGLWTAIG